MLLTRPGAACDAPAPARRAGGWWALGTGAALAAAAFGGYLADVAAHSPGQVLTWFDLRVYLAAGEVAWHAPATLYGWQLQPGIRFTYTPFAAFLFASAVWLPPRVLGWLMTSASIGCAGLACWLTLGGLGWRGRRRAGLALAVAAAGLWSEPVARTLRLGQVELLLMALVIWDLCGSDRRRWKGAGVGFAAAVKLVPLIFIPYLLLTRRFRQAAVACAMFVALAGAGFAMLPTASGQWWLGPDFLRATRTGFVGFLANQSLRGLLIREAGGVSASLRVWLVTAAVTAAAGLLAAARLHRSGRPVHGWLTCALTGLLVSPVSWDHHWVWIVPGLAVLAHTAARARGVARPCWWLAAVALAALFGAWPPVWAPGSPLAPWGLIWYARGTPGGTGSYPWDSEYHWHGLA